MSTTDSSSLIAGCRALLITTGSRGDVQPFLVLAHALAEAGACPVVAAPRRFDNLAARFGAEFIGLDDSILDLQDELVGAGPVRAVRSLGRIRPLMRRWLDDPAELAHGESGRADIVVFTQKALGGASVAERLKVPGLPAQLIPTGPPTSAFRAPFAPVGTPRLLYRASRGYWSGRPRRHGEEWWLSGGRRVSVSRRVRFPSPGSSPRGGFSVPGAPACWRHRPSGVPPRAPSGSGGRVTPGLFRRTSNASWLPGRHPWSSASEV